MCDIDEVLDFNYSGVRYLNKVFISMSTVACMVTAQAQHRTVVFLGEVKR
jgi:hypothetical protein